MFIFRWLASHFILFVVIGTAVVAFLNREDLDHWFKEQSHSTEYSVEKTQDTEPVKVAAVADPGDASKAQDSESVAKEAVVKAEEVAPVLAKAGDAKVEVSSAKKDLAQQDVTTSKNAAAAVDKAGVVEKAKSDIDLEIAAPRVVLDKPVAKDETTAVAADAKPVATKEESVPVVKVSKAEAKSEVQPVKEAVAVENSSVAEETMSPVAKAVAADKEVKAEAPPAKQTVASDELAVEDKTATELTQESEAVGDSSLVAKKNAARKAYWDRDFAAAEKAYLALTKESGADADTWGELANVYFAQEKTSEGVDALVTAANLLIATERFWQVASLARVIGKYDSEKEQAIMQKLYATTGNK